MSRKKLDNGGVEIATLVRKSLAGRPAKFKSEQELSLKIEEYIEACINYKMMPNKAGLRLHLNIDKSLYFDYKERYPNPIKKAEEFIENAWVQRLKEPAATGAIFYLKNAFFQEYKDRHEADIIHHFPKPILANVLHSDDSNQEDHRLKEKN